MHFVHNSGLHGSFQSSRTYTLTHTPTHTPTHCGEDQCIPGTWHLARHWQGICCSRLSVRRCKNTSQGQHCKAALCTCFCTQVPPGLVPNTMSVHHVGVKSRREFITESCVQGCLTLHMTSCKTGMAQTEASYALFEQNTETPGRRGKATSSKKAFRGQGRSTPIVLSPAGSTCRARCSASDVAKSALAGVTARIMALSPCIRHATGVRRLLAGNGALSQVRHGMAQQQLKLFRML